MANGVGRRTAAAGTKIRVLLLPSPYGYTTLTGLNYTAGATAHTATVLRSLGSTTASSVAASGTASFTLAGDPGPSGNLLAANDLVAIRETDGVTRLYVVQSYAASTLTLTTNLTTGVAVGSRVWDFGVEADTDPATGNAHETFALAASTTTALSASGGVIGSHQPDEPVLVSIDNITNAGVLDSLQWGMVNPGSVLLSTSDISSSAIL